LPARDIGRSDWRIVEALSRLLQLASGHLVSVFQEAGEVDFVEVASRALWALEDDTGATELAMQLDYRIGHLLVDEFQDTSPSQVKLLEKLTSGWEAGDGRTIFCVGDPMQSIYRFRKAEVGLFLRVAEFGIGTLHLERLHLALNNRSCPAVVEWVDKAFSRIFPQHDHAASGAIRYREFVATRDTKARDGVFVHPLVADHETNSDALSRLEAEHIAVLIAAEQAKDRKRTIAVLVRSRSHLKALVTEIRAHHARLLFQAVEVEALAQRQAVQDALSLVLALLHRADRVHWLALLRASWCGMTLRDLYHLAADDHSATIWQLMQDEERLTGLSADGQKRLLHVREVIKEAFVHQGRQSLRRWIESTWMKLGGPECLWEAGDVRDVQAFFDLVEKQHALGRLSTPDLQDAMTKLYAAPDVKADGSVQFMTIHKSKGLQFDTVILPGLNRPPRNHDAALLLWEAVDMEGEDSGLIAAPFVPRHLKDDVPSTYDYLKGMESERAANETARLLYVAATRTVRSLHLFGAVKLGSEGDIKPLSNTFLGILWDSVVADFAAAAENPVALEDETSSSTSFIPELIRLPHCLVPEILKDSGGNQPDVVLGDKTDNNISAPDLEISIGILAHRYMEIIAREGLSTWPSGRIQSLKDVMERWLRQQGHTEQESRQGAATVTKILLTTIDSEHGRWTLQPRESAVSERSVTTLTNGVATTHIIDRTFIENGERWIIDYKSTQLDASLADAELSQQAERYRPQLERYAEVFRDEGLRIRKAVFFIATGRLAELD
jgi:ATP-dependent exoDNAse (exonuclease V) beta subunit